MLITTVAFALALSGSEQPVMRIPAAGLRLAEPADAALFARRVADQSRVFCAVHVERITPEHVGNPKVCERGMAQQAMYALPHDRRAAFYSVGGRRMVARLQR